MRLMLAISFAFAALVGACSQPNQNHCANLDGDATCNTRSVDTPYCSRCVAENDGCVAEPVTDETCEVGSTSVAPATSSTSPTTSTSTSTGTDDTTSAIDPVTTAPTTTTPTTTTTGDPTTSTSTTTGTTTTTTDTSTGTTSPSTDTTDTSTGDTTTGTTAETTTDTTTTTTDTSTATSTDATTMDGPMCGDGVQEDPEICDGNDLNGLNCVTKNPTKYGGGSLKCGAACGSYDETMCCLAQGQPCTPNSGQKCCPDLKCTLLLGLGKCQP
jgi:hypothetical protein